MAKPRSFAQFAPDSHNPSAPGSYGWGFDLNGYRIVMYGPPSHDHPIIAEIERSGILSQRQEPEPEEKSRKHKKKDRKEARKDEHARPNANRREEHGPAHVHVIDKQSGRESRFELIEHYDHARNHVQMMESNGTGHYPLTPNQISAVMPILAEYSQNFIQLWREFYADTKLSNYVTRISEKMPRCRERIFFEVHKDNKCVELEDTRTSEKAIMRFDDYVSMRVHPKLQDRF